MIKGFRGRRVGLLPPFPTPGRPQLSCMQASCLPLLRKLPFTLFPIPFPEASSTCALLGLASWSLLPLVGNGEGHASWEWQEAGSLCTTGPSWPKPSRPWDQSAWPAEIFKEGGEDGSPCTGSSWQISTCWWMLGLPKAPLCGRLTNTTEKWDCGYWARQPYGYLPCGCKSRNTWIRSLKGSEPLHKDATHMLSQFLVLFFPQHLPRDSVCCNITEV